MADLHQDDPKRVWRDQETETSTMSLVLIRQKERELRTRKRRQVFGTFVAPIVVAFFYAFCVKQFPHIHPSLHTLLVFSLAWSVAGMYFLNRATSSGAMPGDAGFSTGIEFCRREMERQLSYFRRVLLWSFGPILVAIGIFVLILASRTSVFPGGIPFIALAVLWVAAYLFIRARQQRNLKRELNEFNDIESSNS